jgi:Rrf2 family transcriptional regulator, iron-sulfur cluster assembly transcription factor
VKLQAPEEYGLRCLLQLASEPSGFLRVPQIAQREGLTTAYATKLLGSLRAQGFVCSVRGQKGGYQLARPPSEINVGEVLEALGGRLYAPEFCFDHKVDGHNCVHRVDCSVRALWAALDAAVGDVLATTNLSHLLCGERQATVWLRRKLGTRPRHTVSRRS